MALETTTITGLPNATTPLAGTERVPVDQGGATKDASTQDIANLANTAIEAAVNAHVEEENPHPQYLTQDNIGDQFDPAGTADAAIAAHIAEEDPHGQYAQTAADLDLGASDTPIFAGLTITGTGAVSIPHIHGSIAGNFYVHVRNTSGAPLAAGTAVYATGSVGDTDRITVAACDPTDSAKMPAIGILETTLANNGNGDAVILGELRPLNTAGFGINQHLYVGPSGALTGTRPTSGIVQAVGTVARVQSETGTVVVHVGDRLGTAAATDTTDYATAAQGALADTAVQPGNAALSDARTPTAHKTTHATGGTDALTPGDIGAATAAQGAKADTAVQSVAGAAPITSSGGTTPSIGISAATTSAPGSMSAADKTKLDEIAAGAEVNVNADWSASSGDAQILNKPTLGTAAAAATTDFATAAQGSKADTAVQSVTGTAPITSSGGTTPAIGISAATTSAAGSMSAADKLKLDGVQAGAQVNVGTDLSYTASSRLLASSTGADVTLPEATTSAAGLLSSADKTKLDGVQAGAEVNVNADWNASSGDAQILNKPSIPAPADAVPLAPGTAAVGTSTEYAREDHVHPLPATVTTSAAGLQPATSFAVIAYASTVTLDMAALNGQVRKVNVTGPLTLAVSNIADGQTLALRLVIDGTDRTLTVPAWSRYGYNSTTLKANKVYRLAFEIHGTSSLGEIDLAIAEKI